MKMATWPSREVNSPWVYHKLLPNETSQASTLPTAEIQKVN